MGRRSRSLNYLKPIGHQVVAISISESPGLAELGLGKEHLEDAMTEVARHLLAIGASLLYGGDLREEGFSRLLFELVARHQRDSDIHDGRTCVTNYLAWPVHISLPADQIKRLDEALRGFSELVCLDQRGNPMRLEVRQKLAPQPPSPSEWREGLTAMRRAMAASSDARVVLGGKTENFKGRMPGVGEEALIALECEQPLYLLGGFGGCARDIAIEIGLVNDSSQQRSGWDDRNKFAVFSAHQLHNGLSLEENRILANTIHIDEAVTLIMRGLMRLRQVRKKQNRKRPSYNKRSAYYIFFRILISSINQIARLINSIIR